MIRDWEFSLFVGIRICFPNKFRGQRGETGIEKTAENIYSLTVNGLVGVVYVKVFIKNGGVYKTKLVVTK